MKRTIITTILCSAFTTSFALSWEGSGTESDPYQISNAEHLIELSDEVNKGNSFYDSFFTITNDIDLNQTSDEKKVWIPIGSPTQYFEGTIYGNNHSISHLYNKKDDNIYRYFGLFGYVGENGTIDGIVIEECQFTVSAWIGGIAGANNGIIKNCSIKSGSINSWRFAGGIVGTNFNLVINCENHGSINSSACSGGICGYNYGSIIDCNNYGDVTGNEGSGGIVGYNGGFNETDNCFEVKMGFINHCYNKANILGTKKVGGIIGRNDGFLINSINTGEVTGETGIGGLTGYNGGFDGVTGHISNSYNIGTIISNTKDVGGITGFNNTSGEAFNTYTSNSIISLEQTLNSSIGTNLGNFENCFTLTDSTIRKELVDTLNQWISQNMNNEYYHWYIDETYPTLEYDTTLVVRNNNVLHDDHKLIIIGGFGCLYLSANESIRIKIFMIDGKCVKDVKVRPYIMSQIPLEKGIYIIENRKIIVR